MTLFSSEKSRISEKINRRRVNKHWFVPAKRVSLVSIFTAMFTVSSLVTLGGCSTRSTQPDAMGIGANPNLPAPNQKLIPTVKIAPAVGWPADKKPVRSEEHTSELQSQR